MAASTPYNLQQQAFVLSALVAQASGKVQSASPGPDNVPNLQAYLAQQVTALLGASSPLSAPMGAWSVVWGPCVALDAGPTTVANQAVLVARNASSPGTFVVAIAGTNGLSTLDTQVEDGDLLGAPWPLNSANPAGAITSGTAVGLNTILAMYDAGTKLTLVEALKAFGFGGRNTLVFTGHSLGGALASALALNLAGRVGSWAETYVMPTAAPTVGDAGFATAFTQAFPSTQGPAFPWNENVVNSLDVVPLAWARLSGIPAIYPAIPDLSTCLGSVASALELKARSFGIGRSFSSIPQSALAGQFVTNGSLKPLTYWLAEAAYQHLVAYPQLMQVPELAQAIPPADPFDPSSSTGQAVAAACQKLSQVNGCSGMCGASQVGATRLGVTVPTKPEAPQARGGPPPRTG